MGSPLVLVVGSLHHDVIVRADRLPMLDETLPGSDVEYVFGGKGGNQAIAAMLHGAPTSMAGRVGDDPPGRLVLAHLDAVGVDRSMVKVDNVLSTGMSVAIVTAGGDYAAVIVSAANLAIDATGIEIPQAAKILLIQNEVPAAVNVDVASKAKAAGMTVILNAAPVREADPGLLDLVDVLIVNRVEAAAMSGQSCDTPEEASKAVRRLATDRRASLVTMGAGGVVLSCGGDPARHEPAHKVVAVSTHGAGDLFTGALAARLALGFDMPDAIRYAQAAAALHVSRHDRRAVTPADVLRLTGERRID
jgi:ribokinase